MKKMTRMRLSDLTPTQSDDGRSSQSSGPIQVYEHKGRWLIKHGHHRYYREGSNTIEVEIVDDPHYR